MKLTAKFCEKAQPAGNAHFRDHKDDQVPGLYLRVLASGSKRWVMMYRIGSQRRKPVIGDYPAMSLADARSKALDWRAQIKNGLDPKALADQAKTERLAMPTVAQFADTYIARHAKPNKRSWPEDRRILDRYIIPAIGKLPMNRVNRLNVLALLDGIRDRGKQVQANRVLAVVRKMFAFAVERAVIEVSPVVGINSVRETPRERILNDDELRVLWIATEADAPMMPATRLALRLLVLTGQRAGEVCGLTRDEIDLEKALWTLPGKRSKNRLTHTILLSDAAAEVVGEAMEVSWSKTYVFPAARGDLTNQEAKHLTNYALVQAMERIFPFPDRPTIHDIRRTVGTRLSEANNRLIVDKVLNHKDRTVGGIYDRYAYDREKRAALVGWGRRLQAIIAGDLASKVVPLHAG